MKTTYNFVGNVGLYSVGKGMRKTHFKKLQAVSFVSHSQLGLSREVTRKIQPGMRLFRFQHVLLTWPFSDCHSRASCKISFITNLHQTLTHNPYIKSYNKYREMIEQNYNKIRHKIKANIKHSCKLQLYICNLVMSCCLI